VQSPDELSNKYPSAFLALSAYFGTEKYLQPYIDEDIFIALSDEQTTRAKNALNERISVIPRAKGMYWVVSYSKEQPTRYSINLNASTCTCADYLYNCDPDTGFVCKHIWRVRYLLSQDALPDETENPYNWLLIRLDKDRRFYLSQQEEELYQEAMDLREKIGQTDSYNINYWWAYRRRAEILAKLQSTGDMSVFEQTPKTIKTVNAHNITTQNNKT
jgi:predicted nucleic acid-binding Zn finger protein